MPVSAYIQSVAYFLLAAVALFASAGTVAIATYWVYLAIFAAVFIVSFLWLDPDLAREACGRAGNGRRSHCSSSPLSSSPTGSSPVSTTAASIGVTPSRLGCNG
jgi:hypothetical protein